MFLTPEETATPPETADSIFMISNIYHIVDLRRFHFEGMRVIFEIVYMLFISKTQKATYKFILI